MNNYIRVLPRDAFNEAKLLKCLGKLTLLIEDKMAGDLRYEFNGGSFYIKQSELTGDIYCKNIYFFLDGEPITFHTPLNSRHPWPLICTYNDELIEVFDNAEGELTEFFKKLISFNDTPDVFNTKAFSEAAEKFNNEFNKELAKQIYKDYDEQGKNKNRYK